MIGRGGKLTDTGHMGSFDSRQPPYGRSAGLCHLPSRCVFATDTPCSARLGDTKAGDLKLKLDLTIATRTAGKLMAGAVEGFVARSQHHYLSQHHYFSRKLAPLNISYSKHSLHRQLSSSFFVFFGGAGAAVVC